MIHLWLSSYHICMLICMLIIWREYNCLLDFSLITSFYPFHFKLTILSFVFFSYKHINKGNYEALSHENLSSSMFLALNFLLTLKQNGIWLSHKILRCLEKSSYTLCIASIMYINVSHSSNWIDIDNK